MTVRAFFTNIKGQSEGTRSAECFMRFPTVLGESNNEQVHSVLSITNFLSLCIIDNFINILSY